jgi:hypothetical protein
VFVLVLLFVTTTGSEIMNIRKLKGALMALCLLLALSACGHKHNSSATNASVRVVNATHVAGLALTATNSASSSSSAATVATGVAAGAASSYVNVTTGSTNMVGSVADGSLTASNSAFYTLNENIYYTFVAYSRNGIINLVQMVDNQSAPATGFSLLSVYNPTPDAGPLDIYLVTPGATVDSTVTPKYQNVYQGGSTLAQFQKAPTILSLPHTTSRRMSV